MKRVTFLEDDLKVIFKDYMYPAGFLHDGQEIVGFEYRTRKIKKGGDFYKEVIPPDARDLFEEGESEELVKVVVLLKGSYNEQDGDDDPAD